LMPSWRLARAFPPSTLDAVERAIAEGETRHSGQVRVALEHALDLGPLLRGCSARERALEVFSLLRVWDTEQNNGVLIYLLLADRDVEIVADRGIASRVGRERWEAICHEMERDFAQGRYESGLLRGVESVSAELA